MKKAHAPKHYKRVTKNRKMAHRADEKAYILQRDILAAENYAKKQIGMVFKISKGFVNWFEGFCWDKNKRKFAGSKWAIIKLARDLEVDEWITLPRYYKKREAHRVRNHAMKHCIVNKLPHEVFVKTMVDPENHKKTCFALVRLV